MGGVGGVGGGVGGRERCNVMCSLTLDPHVLLSSVVVRSLLIFFYDYICIQHFHPVA